MQFGKQMETFLHCNSFTLKSNQVDFFSVIYQDEFISVNSFCNSVFRQFLYFEPPIPYHEHCISLVYFEIHLFIAFLLGTA